MSYSTILWPDMGDALLLVATQRRWRKFGVSEVLKNLIFFPITKFCVLDFSQPSLRSMFLETSNLLNTGMDPLEQKEWSLTQSS